MPDGHYVYCRDVSCVACLPSSEDLDGMHVLALWGEMLARCIAQTPDTKSVEGARAAIDADDAEYRAIAVECRSRRIERDDWTTVPILTADEIRAVRARA